MAQRNIEIVQTKVDIPTILVEHAGRMLPIHSKYNPITEAEHFIDSLAEEIEKSDHLLFYGVGLGYHVKVAQERYPEKVFSVYEPIEQVSNQFVSLASTTGIKLNELVKNYVELSTDNIIPNIIDFSIYFAHRILLITLPIYEKLVPNEIKEFNDTYKKVYKEKVGSKQTDKKFSERWAINMMMNVKHTFNTPNLLMQDNNPFEGMPVILAAAGPSLSDEIKNLKHIKERGLAYIFAVGSANKALLKNNIMPDAVLSYDPQGKNWKVFEEMMEQNIDTIPLIFGTTVGHETVDYYPGPKTHVVISKDTLTPYLHDAEMVTVNDSSTISNVTFQILQKLNVSKVILVGQNFAYRDNQFYASEIKRYDELTKQHTDGKLKNVEIEKSFYVEDVYGNEVRTNITFDTMRKEMEYYLSINPDLVVLNTTKNGAKIIGAPFVSLEELLENELTESFVQDNWYGKLHLPKTTLQQKKLTKLKNENKKFIELFEEVQSGFEYLREHAYSKNIQKINRILAENMKLIDKLHRNLIYKLFINALTDIYIEQTYAEVSLCNKISSSNEKTKKMANIYLNYIGNVLDIYGKVISIFNTNVLLRLEDYDELKFYDATCGVFHYEGEWEKNWISRREKVENSSLEVYGVTVKTKLKNTIISFHFKGSRLKLFGINNSERILELKLKIDDIERKIILSRISDKNLLEDSLIKTIFETDKLSKGLHRVDIQVMSDSCEFSFIGAKASGLVTHVNEVMNIKEIQVGKRIRYHYEANYKNVGEFNLSTIQSNSFIPIQSLPNPKGDFYFIAVEETSEYIKLIADRVIQNGISWINLDDKLETSIINLPSCGFYTFPSYKNNDWDKYIRNKDLEWNIKNSPLTWGKQCCLSDVKTRKFAVTVRGDIKVNRKKTVIDAIDMDGAGSMHNLPEYGFRPVLKIEKRSI